MKSSSPPPPPNPQVTAQAQAQANQKTATTQQQLNMVDQITPYGSLDFERIGTWDGSGTPRYQATTTLTPEQQALLEQQQRFGGLVNRLGIEQTERLTGHLDAPIDLSDAAISETVLDAYQPYIDRNRSEQRARLETMLVNKGLRPGTEAYEREVRNFNANADEAYGRFLAGQRGQALNELLTARNQPINEITALMSGGQVTQPGFAATPQTGVAGTDIAGLTMDAYKYGPFAQWQADQKSKQAMMGGISDIGAALAGGWAMNGFTMSDKRLKQDIKKVGKLDDGTKIYAYRYKGHPMMQLGVMAQEMEKAHPDAVAETDSGYMAVNYSRIAEDVAA